MREETIAVRGECVQSAVCEGICEEYLTIHSKWSGRNRCRRALRLSAGVRLVRDYDPTFSELPMTLPPGLSYPLECVREKYQQGNQHKAFL